MNFILEEYIKTFFCPAAAEPATHRTRESRFCPDNVPEYAKPRRCFQHKLSFSDNTILAPQTLNFNKRGLGEENSDTLLKVKIYRYFLNRILGVIGCKLFSFFDFHQLLKGEF